MTMAITLPKVYYPTINLARQVKYLSPDQVSMFLARTSQVVKTKKIDSRLKLDERADRWCKKKAGNVISDFVIYVAHYDLIVLCSVS